MSQVSLIRTVRFSAGHRYWRGDWSEERNRQTFGASANPHGHNYSLEVTVRGEVDPDTGFVVDLAALDALLERVVGPLDQQDLNQVVPEARAGRMIPTTESLAAWFWEGLRGRLPGEARLVRVRVAESDLLAAEIVEPGP